MQRLENQLGRSVTDQDEVRSIRDAIEELHSDYMEWFRDDLMGFGHSRRPQGCD